MAPTKRDLTETKSGEELVIVRKPPVGALGIIFCAAWLAVWAISAGSIVRLMLLGLPFNITLKAVVDPEAWIALGIVSFFCLLGAAALYWCIFSGPQVLRVTREEIVLTKQFGKEEKIFRWRVAEISQMKLVRVGGKAKQYVIRFSYQGRTVSLLRPSDFESTDRMHKEIRTKLGLAG